MNVRQIKQTFKCLSKNNNELQLRAISRIISKITFLALHLTELAGMIAGQVVSVLHMAISNFSFHWKVLCRCCSAFALFYVNGQKGNWHLFIHWLAS